MIGVKFLGELKTKSKFTESKSLELKDKVRDFDFMVKSPSSKSVLIVPAFFEDAKLMRQEFEDRFSDPRSTRPDRFCWDYWHIPDQYTALRTPAYHFFDPKVYDAFHQRLVWWGRQNLGCHDVSPPWMSCYIDGCKQNLHGDLPHGPWAFVFSLTPWTKRKFEGGETLLLREDILSYWQSYASQRGLEKNDVFTEIPALFNRLTVFDPRIPHGVKEVRGPHDVRDGRLVIHGWFVNPRPFIEGALKPREVQAVIDDLSGVLNELFASGDVSDVQGVLSLKLQVDKKGAVTRLDLLSNSLRDSDPVQLSSLVLINTIRRFLRAATFAKKPSGSAVTLPLIFQSGEAQQ
jgi:hypothetical protein